MFTKSASKPQTRIDCLISAGTRVVGDIHFTGGLRIDGEVLGNVFASEEKTGTLVLSEQARVTGSVVVAHAIVNGAIEGPVRVAELLELQSNAKVVGDIEYKTIEIHLGAVVQGRLVHRGSASSDESPSV